MRASLEAELGATRTQLEAAREEGVGLRAQAAAAASEAEAALGAKEQEAASWKAKWKAQANAAADAEGKLDAAERRVLAEAAAHAAVLSQRDTRISELDAQLQSGRPQEAHMFAMAREQAKRDEEVGRLRAQLSSLREMLRESHKVLKHLMRQEGNLKEELEQARRNNERADSLNVEYLKNVVVAFLTKVYGAQPRSPARPPSQLGLGPLRHWQLGLGPPAALATTSLRVPPAQRPCDRAVPSQATLRTRSTSSLRACSQRSSNSRRPTRSASTRR